MGKTVYFQGSNLEKHIKNVMISDKILISDDTTVCDTIQIVLLIVANKLYKDWDSKQSIVISDNEKSVVQFKIKGRTIVGNFALKNPARLKTKPVYLLEILEKSETQSFLLDNLNLKVMPDIFADLSRIVFSCIKEWVLENPEDELVLFSIFKVSKKQIYISHTTLTFVQNLYSIYRLENVNKKLKNKINKVEESDTLTK